MKTLREIMREGFIFAVQRNAPVSVAARVMETHNVGIVAEVTAWQSRPLERALPGGFLRCATGQDPR